MKPLLADPALKPAPADIATAREQALSLLEIRKSTPLFHLGAAELVQQKVSFPTGGPDQTPGVIVMHIDDTTGPDVDSERTGVVVVFNASDTAATQTVPGAEGQSFGLHPVQRSGSDDVVKAASFDPATGSFTVPPLTVAVFEAK